MNAATHVTRNGNTFLKPSSVRSDDKALVLTTKGWVSAYKTKNSELTSSGKFRKIYKGLK